MTQAVTVAIRERLERERASRRADPDLPARIERLAAQLRKRYDTRPVTKAEWTGPAGMRIDRPRNSALVAIMLGEPGSLELRERLASDPDRVMSVASSVEAGTVIAGRLGPRA